MKNETATGNGHAGRIEAEIEKLRERMRETQAALAAAQLQKQKRERREGEKEEALIGAAVVKAAALSPEFKLAVAQVALANVTDPKQRQFLASRGWEV